MQDFGRDYRKERMKQVFEMKEMHEETRKQQKQARANTLEVEPDAILPELSGQCFSSVKVEPCNLCVTLIPQIRHFGIQVEMMN